MMADRHPAGHELQAFHDGELAPDETVYIANHCAECTNCQAELAELAQLEMVLADDPEPELSRTVWHRVQARRRDGSFDGVRLGPAFASLAVAACVAGIVVGIWFGPIQFGAQDKQAELAWSESSSLWSGSTSASLLDVFTLDQE